MKKYLLAAIAALSLSTFANPGAASTLPLNTERSYDKVAAVYYYGRGGYGGYGGYGNYYDYPYYYYRENSPYYYYNPGNYYDPYYGGSSFYWGW